MAGRRSCTEKKLVLTVFVCVCVSAERQVFRPSEGRDSLVQLIRLCNDPNLVGVKLLENLSTVPLRELSCSESTPSHRLDHASHTHRCK